MFGLLEFSYFLIWFAFSATSTGSPNSLVNTKDGHCLTDNMKMQIYICNGNQGKFFFLSSLIKKVHGLYGYKLLVNPLTNCPEGPIGKYW